MTITLVAVVVTVGFIHLGAHWYLNRVDGWYQETRRSSPAVAIARYESKPWWIRAFEWFA